MSKRITRVGNLFQVYDGEYKMYETTEYVLLNHWMQRHDGPYFYDPKEVNLGAPR